MDLGERFWSKVEKAEDCWLWTAATNPKGYGKFAVGDRKWKFAHRLVYESEVGPIPKDRIIGHKCDTPSCVRPDHLEAITDRQNRRDAHERRLPHGRHKRLTPTEVAEIRRDWDGHYGQQRRMAKKYGVTRNAIWQIVTRRTWKED